MPNGYKGDTTTEEEGFSDSLPGTDDEELEDLDLVFRDKKTSGKHCLILQEFDGKGVFIMRNEADHTDKPVLGLSQIVHFIPRRNLGYPHTIRDIIREYVEDVSIYEHSRDRMNLTTNYGHRINLDKPPISLFQQDKSVTLYLQNKKYLTGDQAYETTPATNLTRGERLIVAICSIFVLLTPYVMYCLISWDKETMAKLNSF